MVETGLIPICLHSKPDIAAFLRSDVFLHLYELGDLDDFFWNYTTWYALQENHKIKQLVLIYTQADLPVLLGLTKDIDSLKDLLRSILYLLPKRFYAHLSGDAVEVFAEDYQVRSHGLHFKMVLTDPTRLNTADPLNVIPLTGTDAPALKELYQASYPSNWFEPRMLETKQYFGIKQGLQLISVAGVHTYSPEFSVATLGNITTHPASRNQGLGKAVSTQLCRSLLQTVQHIGLNVRTDNAAAISCYTKLGFKVVATYEEYALELK